LPPPAHPGHHETVTLVDGPPKGRFSTILVCTNRLKTLS
jgi:hypothetical protein